MASFGENLRRERESRGVSLREMANSTKIGVRFLQAIEEDRLERTDPFYTFDVHVGRRFPLKGGMALGVRLLARNITNEFQPDLDLGPSRDSGYVYGPRFPRRIALNVGFEF